ncbi:hypothetical protein KIW84_052127 [Lathyrus oleraceus]|uniref:RNase H type-1 domain-containing protein n=1 Tax=Pisum sativum TaxID=3888 RepID=A0A9D5AH10_PEA|nr:hypothetical protein KIW84_052127 [Pisum sativum]
MKFPSLTNLFSNVHIPIKEKEYACIWSPVGDGFLTIKVAYRYKNIAAPILTWGKFTWNIHIPTFRSLIKLVVLAAIINTITVIWQARNKLRFNNIRTHWKTALNAIIADVSRTGNATLKIGSFSMLDLNTHKCFNVKLNPPKSCDVSCGGFYGDHSGKLIGSFLMNIGVGNTFTEELTTAMMDIETARDKNWNHLWLESDSKSSML